ncbi:MAG: cyclic nucleotide-binding domain-containing protein [Bacteriovoracia bacterium]
MNKLQPKDSRKIEDWVKHLESVVLFNGLKSNKEALRAFAENMEERIFAPNSKIIVEGEASTELFILISGEASVFKRTPEGDSYKVANLSAKQHAFFGEGGLISSETRSATITSNSDCHCLVLNGQHFETLSQKYPQWAMPFYRQIAGLVLSRLRKTNTDLMLLYNALVAEIRG